MSVGAAAKEIKEKKNCHFLGFLLTSYERKALIFFNSGNYLRTKSTVRTKVGH
jgi:hypothetical protein